MWKEGYRKDIIKIFNQNGSDEIVDFNSGLFYYNGVGDIMELLHLDDQYDYDGNIHTIVRNRTTGQDVIFNYPNPILSRDGQNVISIDIKQKRIVKRDIPYGQNIIHNMMPGLKFYKHMMSLNLLYVLFILVNNDIYVYNSNTGQHVIIPKINDMNFGPYPNYNISFSYDEMLLNIYVRNSNGNSNVIFFQH